MLDSRPSLPTFMARLQSTGRVSFTRQEAIHALGITDAAFLKAASRLQKKKQLLNPRHGFYVVVPPQYLAWGAPPPNWYIDDMMRHEGRAYYVGLLKAAELLGATHHAVMEFQVVTDKQIPKIRAGRSLIVFHYRKDLQLVVSGIESRKTDTGSMKISSIELTALDLLRYTHAVGGLDAIATALADLGARIDGSKLAKLARHFERAVVQRLGYLLDHLGFPNATEAMREYLVEKSALPWVALEPQPRGKDASSLREPTVERSERWHVIVHRHPEIDE